MEAVGPAVVALVLCTLCGVIVLLRARRSRGRSANRADLVEQALVRARAKQRAIAHEEPRDKNQEGPQAAYDGVEQPS